MLEAFRRKGVAVEPTSNCASAISHDAPEACTATSATVNLKELAVPSLGTVTVSVAVYQSVDVVPVGKRLLVTVVVVPI